MKEVACFTKFYI